jgi:hypothetical protein
MKLAVTLLLLAATTTQAQYGLRRFPPAPTQKFAPDVPLTDPASDYPLRVHIFTAKFGGTNARNHGYGTINLIDPAAPKGFDFGFECDFPFIPNSTPTETYQARWHKQPFELEILTLALDTNKAHTCRLKLAPENIPFDATNLVKFTHGVSSSLRIRWSDPDFAYEVADPDYLVQFHVLDTERREAPRDDVGVGTANLFDPQGKPATLQGAEFHYECNYGFLANSQRTTYYQGHWVKPGHELEILLQRPGTTKVDKCIVDLTFEPQPYPERRTASTPKAPNAPPANQPVMIERTPPSP